MWFGKGQKGDHFQRKILGFYRELFSRGKTHGFLRKYFSNYVGFWKFIFKRWEKFHKLWKILLRVKMSSKNLMEF